MKPGDIIDSGYQGAEPPVGTVLADGIAYVTVRADDGYWLSVGDDLGDTWNGILGEAPWTVLRWGGQLVPTSPDGDGEQR